VAAVGNETSGRIVSTFGGSERRRQTKTASGGPAIEASRCPFQHPSTRCTLTRRIRDTVTSYAHATTKNCRGTDRLDMLKAKNRSIADASVDKLRPIGLHL